MRNAKKLTPRILAAAVVLAAPAAVNVVAAPAAVAQQQAEPAFLVEQQAGQKLSDSYIGADVVARAPEGLESVGKVTDLLIDETGKIAGVVVDVGGFLGVGAKSVGLSWAGLEEMQSEGELMLRTGLTRQELEDAPAFKTADERQLESDRKVMEEVAPTAPSQPAD